MTDIRTIAPEQLASMSLEDACRAVQKLYTPEEWKRMAHTVAATFTAEEIVEASEEELRCPSCGKMFHTLHDGLCSRCGDSEVAAVRERYTVSTPASEYE